MAATKAETDKGRGQQREAKEEKEEQNSVRPPEKDRERSRKGGEEGEVEVEVETRPHIETGTAGQARQLGQHGCGNRQTGTDSLSLSLSVADTGTVATNKLDVCWHKNIHAN